MIQPLSFENQVNRLKEHGIIINNDDFALSCLSNVNYYRLRGYWLSFEDEGVIANGTTFEDIWEVYLLDCEIRNLILRCILSIEIKLRTQFSNALTMSYGAFAHKNADLFVNKKSHAKAIQSISKEIERAKNRHEKFVIHNLAKYNDLPMWACVELMSFGNLSLMFGNLKEKLKYYGSSKPLVVKISSSFGVPYRYFKSWLRHLCYVRNICAHQSRLYNNQIKMSPKMNKSERVYTYGNDGQFSTFIILKHLYEHEWEEQWKKYLSELNNIISIHPNVSLKPMGFPNNWLDVLNIDQPPRRRS